MRKKWFIWGVGLFLLYAGLIYIYLFHLSDTSLPQSLKGTAVDPATFMDKDRIAQSEQYSNIRNFLFFISTPLDWLFYMTILLVGFSKGLEKWGQDTWKSKSLQTGAFVFWFSLLSFVVFYPLSYLSYKLSIFYGISTQSFSSWMKDNVIDFWVNFGFTLIIVLVLYSLIRISEKRWWLYAWLLSIPFTFLVMFIQPVVIDPLYNDFYELKDKQLEGKILDLADEAGIPADHVFEVNMSKKTNSFNAYVTGIGSNSRIVLWDTTLNALEDDEILYIMAHEMAHYVKKHIYFGISSYLLLTFFGLWLTDKIMKAIIRRWGEILHITSLKDIRTLPLYLLITSMLLFAANPITNYISRVQETSADKYALELTEEGEPVVRALQKLSNAGLSQMNPPKIVKWFRYSHPTMVERIQMAESFEDD